VDADEVSHLLCQVSWSFPYHSLEAQWHWTHSVSIVVLHSTRLVATGLMELLALSRLALFLPEGPVLCPLFACQQVLK
jgi:hypothetical protein